MRTDFAQLAVTVLYTVPGIAVLVSLRIIRLSPWPVLAALGLAYLVGMAALLLVGVLLLCVGGSFSLPWILAAAICLTLAAVVPVVRRGREQPPAHTDTAGESAPRDAGWWVAAATLAALAIYAYLGFRAALVDPLDGWDSWSIWARKARVLLDSGAMPTEFLTSAEYSFMHPDYPLLFPLFESTFFRLAGTADTRAMHGQLWILFTASLWAAAFLVGRLPGRTVLWSSVIALIAVAPTLRGQLLSAYADVPMSMLLFVGLLLVGTWAMNRQPAYLALGVLLLGATANLKNEGLSAGAAAIGALLLTSALFPGAVSRGRALLAPALAAGGFLLLVLPWRLWLSAHDISGDMPIGKGLSPSYLFDRDERVGPTLDAIAAQVTDQGKWNYLLPLGLAVVVVGLATRATRALATFYLVAGAGIFCSIVWGYWISPNEIGWHLSTSVDRTVDALLLAAAAALLHLAVLLGASLRSGSSEPAAHERPDHA